jgi:hypothetical protein
MIIVYKCIAVNGTGDLDAGRLIRAYNRGFHDRIPVMKVIAFTSNTNYIFLRSTSILICQSNY